MITLFDLAGADPALRFSPYCWRIKLALLHKRLPFEAVPWRFTETDALPPGCTLVPTIIDDDQAITDSWAIACHLEAKYPDHPTLFDGAGGQAHARFISAWSDQHVSAIARMVVADVHGILHEKDRDYFRSSREARFGISLEQVQNGRDDRVAAFRAQFAPLRQVLKRQPWLGGERPSYADFCAVSGLQWAACVSEFALLEPGDAVLEWRTRLLGKYL